jgi:hypothetical protein
MHLRVSAERANLADSSTFQKAERLGALAARAGGAPPARRPTSGLAMRGLVGVPVEVDRRLDVGVAELLLDEVDRLSRGAPTGGGTTWRLA